jgi:hypothetical protein
MKAVEKVLMHASGNVKITEKQHEVRIPFAYGAGHA